MDCAADAGWSRRPRGAWVAAAAYRAYLDTCFWSYAPDVPIGMQDIPWVVEGLKKEGDRRAYNWARRISAAAQN